MPSFFKSFRINVALGAQAPSTINNDRGAQAPSPARAKVQAFVAQALLPVLLLFLTMNAFAQTAPTAPSQTRPSPLQPAADPASKPSISLSPAVIMAKGSFGQGLTQTLTLSNQTGRDFAFDLVAEDVVIKDGKRVFVPAGETPNRSEEHKSELQSLAYL